MATRTSGSVSNQERNDVVHFRKEIRKEWNDLWDQRFEDRQRAEDIARKDYELLFVEKGTVIRATRGYQPLSLEDIIERNEKILGLELSTPRPNEGGYRKFAKDVLSNQARFRKHPQSSTQSVEKDRIERNSETSKGWLRSR